MGTPFAVPIVMFVMIGLTVILRGPLGQAIADRIRGSIPDADPRLREEMDHMRMEVEDLRGQIAEAQERIDFTERLLARRDETVRLPGGGGVDGAQ
jgi:hypothetical protein